MKHHWIFILFLFISTISIISCGKDSVINIEEEIISIPEGFPSINFPEGNEFTKERWLLGKKLFYETRLSKSNSLSCGSCHKPELFFSDNVATSDGDNFEKGTSNVPTLINLVYNPYYTRAGGVPTLEMQVLVPIQEHNEFNHNIVDICKELNADIEYNKDALKCYNREFDPFVLTRAISNFERSFISGNSRFDEYFFQNKNASLTENEIKGLNLFRSNKTNCSQCHKDFNFTNYAFENNGLYEIYADSGRMRLTNLESDRGLFKVPTLRNIEFTAPYMHDGSIQTIEEVIEHYNSGGKNSVNKSEFLKPLHLSSEEKQDLVSFLKALTDYKFLNNKNFKL